ncbi:MAG: tetraacyldisaccharide 4'-kinase [Desulfobacteraceae bacterium]|nr:tetraacyldisaccharide 4'-kinase [Desulfobacteraceae bacterium]
MRQQLTKKIEKIMKSDSVADSFFSFENCLFICSKIYLACVKIRNSSYKFNFIKSKKLPCFIISIGNITAGGTGKTPMTMYVARIIKKFGYKPVIVTRGYQGTYKDAQAIVSDGTDFFLSVHEAGDEACMMAENLKIPVIVGKDRYHAGRLAIKEFDPDVIILDDGFQHIALERDLNLLLCDFNKPFGNFELIPRGRLREPANSVLRSDVVIFTRSDKRDKFNQIQSDLFKAKPIFNTSHSASIMKVVHFNDKTKEDLQSSLNTKNSDIAGFLFSGIADNSDFRSTCKNMGIKIKGFSEFLDHHWYTKKDLLKIYEKHKQSKADFIITTEKDYIKIKEIISDQFPLIVIGITVKFNSDHKEKFENFIKINLKTNQSK